MPQPRPIDLGFFRESEDGASVFFPWGLSHRGYLLDGEAARQKASRGPSFLIGSTVGIGVWTAHALEPLVESEATGLAEILGALVAPGAALLLVFVCYSLWVWRFVERFPESDLQVSREERLREAARLGAPWKVALAGVSVCALSILLVWLEPRAWWLCLLGLAIGVSALLWSFVLKRAAAHPR